MKTAKQKGYTIPVIKRINNYKSKVGFVREFKPDANGNIRVMNEAGYPHIWKFDDAELRKRVLTDNRSSSFRNWEQALLITKP